MHKVLVVEDEALLAMDLRAGLEERKCIVTGIAYSGPEAIEKAGASMPNLVLMDIKLKGEMDGIEAAIQIRDRFGIPIIYLTCNADDGTRQRAIQTRPLRYLEKPIETDALCAIIDEALTTG